MLQAVNIFFCFYPRLLHPGSLLVANKANKICQINLLGAKRQFGAAAIVPLLSNVPGLKQLPIG